jgi:hypothetical protein
MRKALKVWIGVSLLLLTVSALAAENTGRFILPSAAQLNGKDLKAGEYKVRWDGQGPDVQVTVTQGKETVTTATAKLVDRGQKAARNAVVLDSSSGGPSSIVELQLSGKRSALVFVSPTNTAQKQAQ